MTYAKWLVIGLISLTGCATTGLQSKSGLATIVQTTTEGVMATSFVDASKEGQACSQNILGIVSMGDASIEEAKRQGHITKVSNIDYSYLNVLFIYGKFCTIVHGS